MRGHGSTSRPTSAFYNVCSAITKIAKLMNFFTMNQLVNRMIYKSYPIWRETLNLGTSNTLVLGKTSIEEKTLQKSHSYSVPLLHSCSLHSSLLDHRHLDGVEENEDQIKTHAPKMSTSVAEVRCTQSHTVTVTQMHFYFLCSQ